MRLAGPDPENTANDQLSINKAVRMAEVSYKQLADYIDKTGRRSTTCAIDFPSIKDDLASIFANPNQAAREAMLGALLMQIDEMKNFCQRYWRLIIIEQHPGIKKE